MSYISSAAIVIPTYNALPHFGALTSALASQKGISRSQVLVIDSSSKDGTADLFRTWGARVHVIPQSEFDHGGTRRLAVQLVAPAEYIVFLTQDAIPASSDAIEQLLKGFEDKKVGMTYGCQLPRQQARGIERHARIVNYPADLQEIRTLKDRSRLGIKTIFSSDSFAAYRRSALDEVNGMPESAFFAEDQIVAGKMLLQGWHLAYQGGAKVIHSHSYTIEQDFKRYFDVGVFHGRNLWLLQEFGKAEGAGLRFVKSELNYLWKHDRSQITSAIIRTAAKYAGYRLGLIESRIAPRLKQKLSMASYYWRKEP